MYRLKLLLPALFLAAVLPSYAADLTPARTALMQGRVDEAASMLEPVLKANRNDAAANHLLCRVYYSQQLPDRALPACEAAVANDQNNSTYQLWLGRAYGLKADKSGPFTGFSMARRTVAAFERAFQLNPMSADAANDLGEFYAKAPSIVGGGTDKARQLAERIQSTLPAKYHRVLAYAAEKNKDFVSAEEEFKKQILAQRNADTLMDLVAFYDRRQRANEAIAAARDVINADRIRTYPSVDAATFLIEQKRELPLAEKTLREYLVSPARTDLAPAFAAHLELGRLLAARGDSDGARREYEASLSLARNYAPAQRAVQGH